jgi:hypothetical protein
MAQNDYLGNAKSDEERNPLYWAALTMVGEDGPLPLIERKEGIPWVWQFFGLSLTAISLVLALYARRRRVASMPSRGS